MKNKLLLYSCVVIAFLVIIIPFIIYKIFYYWSASDMLVFYGSCLSFIGSTVLGYIAITQSKTSNELSQKMLELEETQNAPIIDIARCSKEVHELPNNELCNAFHICINNSFVNFDSNNNVLECSDTIDLFEIKNISNTNIMQLKIIEISQSTIFQNGECFSTSIESCYNSVPVIMPKDKTLLFYIMGIEYNGPKNMDEKMKFEVNSYNHLNSGLI